MMRGSGSSRRYCFKRQATSWTLASEGMEGLPESRVACVCEVMNQYTLLREREGVPLKLSVLPRSQLS